MRVDTVGTSMVGLAIDVVTAMLSLTWSALLMWLDERLGVDGYISAQV